MNNFICQSKARQKCTGVGEREGMTLNCFPPETKYFPLFCVILTKEMKNRVILTQLTVKGSVWVGRVLFVQIIKS